MRHTNEVPVEHMYGTRILIPSNHRPILWITQLKHDPSNIGICSETS